jgi:A/G-specific adenine glycosylase
MLPWRRSRDPWQVLVSEVMLQQTQASRVIEPFHRFVDRFPTPSACASAGPGEVVRQWAGLGYNRRALNLHRSAVRVVERNGGRIPGDLAGLLELPGVGPYTARAVLSFAFEIDVGVVDTNVGRLLARAVVGRSLSAAEAQALADDLVPVGQGWAYNQTLFDLGARYCTARAPECAACPLGRRCRWRAAGSPLPDPARSSAGTARRQAPFAGSDRQGRGRIVAALRSGPVALGDVAGVAGWPEQPERARRVAGELVEEGLACRVGNERLALAGA